MTRVGITNLEDLPNIGPSIAGDLRRIGITRPGQLKGKDGLALYRRLCRKDGLRHDPCLADCLMAVTDYMSGAAARPWWKYTPRRKRLAPGL